MQSTSHLGYTDQFAEVRGGQVGVTGPLDVALALQLPRDDFGNILELTQW